MIKSLVVVAGLSLVASTAAAETKSWGALKGKIPAGTIILGSADIAAVRATPSFPKLVDWVVAQDKDVAGMFQVVKQACGMELPAMFADIALALDAKDGVLVVGFSGVDQAKVTDCVTKVIAAVDPKIKLSSKVTGKITEYALSGDSDKLYAAWLGPDVVAFDLSKRSHASLDAMLAGQAPSGDLAGYLGKANTGAPAWTAFAPNDEGVAGGFGAVTLGKTIKVGAKITAMSPADGDKGRKELADSIKSGLERSAKLPEMKKVFQGAKVGGKGAEVTIDASFPESSLPQLLPALDKMF